MGMYSEVCITLSLSSAAFSARKPDKARFKPEVALTAISEADSRAFFSPPPQRAWL
jgi:hypothetical protein